MTERRLSLEEVRKLVNEAKASSIRKECFSCDCFQAFLTQLEIDGTPGALQQIHSLQVSPQEIHPCLGCNPCPPAEVFTRYLEKRNRPNGATCGCAGDDEKK